MNIIGLTLSVISILIAVTAGLISTRNTWIYRRRSEFLERITVYNMARMMNGRPMITDPFAIIGPYDLHLRKFYIWNYALLVPRFDLYVEVMSTRIVLGPVFHGEPEAGPDDEPGSAKH